MAKRFGREAPRIGLAIYFLKSPGFSLFFIMTGLASPHVHRHLQTQPKVFPQRLLMKCYSKIEASLGGVQDCFGWSCSFGGVKLSIDVVSG